MTTERPIPPTALDRLREVDHRLDRDLSKHDRVSVLIPVCIDQGITKGSLICLALKLCGYNARHVGITLDGGSAHMPPEHQWYKDSGGQYACPD